MNEYDSIIGGLDTAAPSQAITSLDANPDDGARALQLSQATGVAPGVVYGDLDGFENQHRSALTSGLVRNNDQLAAYIRGNSLADIVSNDDYGNLDQFSRSVPDKTFLDSGRFNKYFYEPVEAGVREAFTEAKAAFTEPYRDEDVEPLLKASAPYRYAFHALDLSRRVLGAVAGATFGGAKGAAGKLAENLGAGETAVGQIRRDVQAAGEDIMGRAGVHPEPEVVAKPWVDAGIEPPRGLHPEIDKIKADLNSEALKALDQNLKDAQSSTTRERSPELFQKFAEQHYGTSTISVSGDTVAALYGDRVPEFNDGLLGWVPGIAEKLDAAKTTGEDVHIPLADWMTRVDPKLAKELHDDLRVWPGGITANEAKEPWEPKPVVDSPLAQVRDVTGTEPMFGIGDRKLELKQTPSLAGHEEFHEYQFLDQSGKSVGELTIIPDAANKRLYILNINGLAGLYANSFGPSLIRDLSRQLKEIYPEFVDEKGQIAVTGHRVSGAREVAGTIEEPLAKPVVKLGADDDGFRQILSERAREDFGYGLTAVIEPTELLQPKQAEVAAAMREEVAKLAPGTRFDIVSDIRKEGIDRGIHGAYITYPDQLPRMLGDLFSPDPVGYARHEAIHHLYRQGLFTPAEWEALTHAAETEGWFERYKIGDRYGSLPRLEQIEEAIAEGFRDWAANRDKIEQPQNLVTQAFQKLMDLWTNIQARMKEIFGRELTADEMFRRVESGEVGRRLGEAEPGAALGIDERMNSLRAEAAGLDLKTYQKLQKLIQTRFDEDVAASLKRAEREQKIVQSKEWKERSKEMAKAVEEHIRQRPDVMADMFVSSGELAGKKLERKRYPLRADDLTAEQKAGLPRHYYSADGLPVDSVAKLVGYPSGDAMIEKMIEYNADRGDMTAREHLKKVIDAETERQMQARYGDLQKNIMLEAQDQALSENNLNILAEEWQGAAMQAGVSVIDKDVAKAEALRIFSGLKVGEIDSTRLMTQMLKHSKDAEKDLIAGRPADAVVRLQRRYMVGLMAAEAKKLEKEVGKFDRTAKQFAKREVPSVEPEYTNFIHQILMKVGKPVRRSAEDLRTQIEAGQSKSLEEFVANKTADLREVPVWPQLFDENWSREVEQLSTEEFRNLHDSIKTLVHNGRDEMKIYRQGEAADFNVVKQKLIQNIADSIDGKVREPRKKSALKSYYVRHLQMENIFNRWDAFDSKGEWNQYIMRDLIDGTNQVDAWKKEYAAKIKDLGVPEGFNRAVDNPIFKDQDTDTLIPFSRKNLIAVMLNTGTESNLVKLARGYKLEPTEVMEWVHEHATKADWEFVQGAWDIFKDIKAKSDTMYRSLSGGVAPESIPARAVDTPHGQFPGGYYPIMFHEEMEGKSKRLMGRDPLEQENYVRASTPAGYTKSRTGYVAPLALDLDQMPGRISQMLHDIGLRPAVLNAAKVFYDHDVRSAIRRHYGEEYKQEMIPYLQGVANSANQSTKGQQAFSQLSELLRQNVITTLVGLNPGTVMKHGPSALVTSIREVGVKEFASAVSGLLRVNEETGQSNWEFAIKNSLELQRRDRNWQETLYGASSELTVGSKLPAWRQRIIEWASKPVALSDMISAVPTWLAKYEGEIANGATHGDAVYEADRAVRRAHGSTAATTRTAMQRESNPWLTSVYNYFSDIMNRQMETIWKAGDTLDLVKEGQKAAAFATVPALTASLFAYALWPAIVEHMVAPSQDDPNESWAKKAAKQMLFTLGSSWVGVRDVASAIVSGRDPQFGLTGTAGREIFDTFRDLNKDHPLRKDHAGRLIQDAAGFVGTLTGMLPQQIGRSARYIHDVQAGIEHPRGPWAWVTGLRFGTTKGHSTTFEHYLKGENR